MNNDLQDLCSLVRTHPIIDNHAHNLLTAENALDYEKYPLESITSEASGEALKQAPYTLSHRLAVKQLAELFNCDPNWEAIKAARKERVTANYHGLVQKCLDGTFSLLLDDLLTDCDIEDYRWHNQFVGSPSGLRRIVRIEAVASQICRDFWGEEAAPEHRMSRHIRRFTGEFEMRIKEHCLDPMVAGFKSVICYRTGLNVEAGINDDDTWDSCQEALHHIVENDPSCRMAKKPLNDLLVNLTLHVIRETASQKGSKPKPIQFHTGLGDNDIDLVLANPAYLQPLIEKFHDVDFVLLHSSYPYTREAGYLASVYPNVYVDLGEVYSMVSKDAELSILRQSMELTPTSRLLWSTDGHFHPETYWLSNKQFRDTLETVVVNHVKQGILTVSEAKDVVVDILFNTSNKLYNLNLSSPITLSDKKRSNVADASFAAQAKNLDDLAALNPNMIVWMQLVDYTAIIRVRMFPIREFQKIFKGQRRIGITMATLHMLQDDTLVPGGTATGQFYMRPDMSSLRKNAALNSNSATVMTFWEDENGAPLEGCPRITLQRIVTALNPIQVTLGFEIEVVILHQSTGGWSPLTKNHSWSNMTRDIRLNALELLETAVTTLASIGIHIEQFHAESAPGQFEFVLPPGAPLEAIDTLIKARQTIQNVAETNGLRATFYPRPYSFAAGTASHAHFSISPTIEEESFLAGILTHFSAITAFSLAQEGSYERVASGIWAGSEWVTWGTQNREAPIRKISTGHWELKQIDGLANMYLAMAALLAAGYLGIAHSLPLTHKDCPVDASTLSAVERQQLGITKQIPKNLDDSLTALENNDDMCAILGPGFVKKYIAVKRAEANKLASMESGERITWLMERY
ncbi:extracellular developmental signal biosynthesis protein FluG [Talaromyces stipitatus ATCC 10500]|uniref:Glutamine synthetase n=1 Tax=Talaromyces stipitatus (strain ATCC 10500 / CBS 375.48 / QM 6759 / NRRL 1006) TaxID=441959 RepID=B8MMH7_TALSN|nr:extracellular developmental signal biosynthesis protein FluG [Talaromyces stipitatus ATCC 10500]EED13731.1 extracellular developmental signal biosynthesis protein FluG [Talaromyces stipitatus ATCC 10500]